jgi:glucosamine-6-phosphate deaminase
VAASFLQEKPGTTVYLDQAAAAELTRIATPWLVGSCQWDDVLMWQAVIWLARKLEKPILKLTDEDYAENGLVELLRYGGGAYHVNLSIFRHLMGTITGWPGGKKEHKRVLILSPHPDDDVICMAGTMTRFVEQGHEVHAAYMTSGYLSVFDHDVERYADFVKEFNRIFALTPEHSASIANNIDRFLIQKRPGEIDTTEVQAIKALVRRTEAIAAARYCGLKDEQMHFLDMPFYNTGRVQKLPIGPDDVALVRGVLRKTRPDLIFGAGDMSDPHGTHRQCMEATVRALEEYSADGNPPPVLWLYRGAWQEWPPEHIDMAVPLAPDELKHKRFAIFRHQSQKDRAMFPGPFDSREFWQRAEERNMSTAATYDALGLPEYHAIEAFARWPLKNPAHLAAQFTKEAD